VPTIYSEHRCVSTSTGRGVYTAKWGVSDRGAMPVNVGGTARIRRPDQKNEHVLQFKQMSNTITVRLPEDLAEWLDAASRKAGVPRGRIIRDQLQLARKREKRPFLRLAGSIDGPPDLSSRKGFSKP
jgi:hypothetical protein